MQALLHERKEGQSKKLVKESSITAFSITNTLLSLSHCNQVLNSSDWRYLEVASKKKSTPLFELRLRRNCVVRPLVHSKEKHAMTSTHQHIDARYHFFLRNKKPSENIQNLWNYTASFEEPLLKSTAIENQKLWRNQ